MTLQYSLVLFITILLIATYFDLKERTIPNYCSLLLLLLTAITEDFKIGESFLYLFALSPIIALFFVKVQGKRAIGGGDVKLILSSSFYMKERVLLGLMIAIHLALLIAILCKVLKKDFKNLNAFAPYLTIGFICSYLI